MPGMFQDLRHGLLALASHPGLTIAAALSLGLAIGAQTSVYCLIDALSQRLPARPEASPAALTSRDLAGALA